jgi:hypothetical protein
VSRTGPGARRPAALRVAAALGVAALAVLAGASPAAADPPRPTDYRSTITSIEPAPDGVEVAIVGGDSFLEVTVDEGHEVEVPGYEGEPYLRFGADGSVERNENSPARYLNDSRQGETTVPASAGEDAQPDWREVASGGQYAWHDHAIHWMGSGSPPGKSPGDVVTDWTIELTVDGTPTEVAGTLVWEHPVSPVPWVALAVAAAAVVLGVGHLLRGDPARVGLVGPAAALVAAAVATVVGWGQYADAPASSGVSLLVVLVPVAGVVLGAAAFVLTVRHRAPGVARAAALAAAAAVLGWAALRIAVLWKPVLSTTLPANVDRAGTAVALGLALAAAGVVVLASGLALSPAKPSSDRTEATPA